MANKVIDGLNDGDEFVTIVLSLSDFLECERFLPENIDITIRQKNSKLKEIPEYNHLMKAYMKAKTALDEFAFKKNHS